jgi:hypothetical protein
MNTNEIHDEIVGRISSRNVCVLVKNLSSYLGLLSEMMEAKIYKTMVLPVT